MKKLPLVLMNIAVALPFVVFFRAGGVVSIFMLPVILVLSIINTIKSKSIIEILIFNLILEVFIIIGIIVNSELYFEYVYYDRNGEMVFQAEKLISAIYVGIITLIECLTKGYNKTIKKKKV